MTSYEVQFELPVDNPMNNVSMRKGKGRITFFVPINHPNAHNMGFQELLAAQERSGLLRLSTPLNKNRVDSTKRN